MHLHRARLRWLSLCAVVCLACGVSAKIPAVAQVRSAETKVPVSAGKPTRNADCEESHTKPGEKSVEQLTALVRKSVVVVSFTGRDGKTKGMGSGFVISSDGLIATNLHVIGEARPIFVETADGKKYKVQSIHATEAQVDLAVLKIDARNLPALPLGDSDNLKQGERIVALGNPQGLEFSVVTGVVSGRRTIDGKPLLQLAIPIERGNSGGPVLDMHGRVHGILTLKSLVTRNLGFAVTINALKPLLEKPNPVPMERWLTIGALDDRNWTTLFGAQWRRRAGRIRVSGRGAGFGGRSLAVAKRELPDRPYELAVQVKLDDESGAAGLVFQSDGKHKHYGFYPSNGKLRLSRFEGPDVYSWKVLQEVNSRHYRPGDWNTLKVRLEKGKIRCFINDRQVIESDDDTLTSEQVGLAKFRDTVAEFRRFRVARRIPPSEPDAKTAERINRLVLDIPTKRPPQPKLVKQLIPHRGDAETVLRRRAKQLEQQAEQLRMLARIVHETETRRQLAELLQREDSDVDLLKAALLIARLDNDEVNVDAYLKQVNRMVADVSGRLKKTDSETKRLKALDHYLFEEMGFHGSRTDYYNSSNSYLNEVIEDREGLPITISVLYMEMARRLGVTVVGVGLPGHFIVRFKPSNGPSQLIDPFDQGKRLTRKEAMQKVAATKNLEWDDEFLKAESKRAILVRMLRNLMGVARDDEDPEAMLRYVETVLVIEPDSGLDRWYRAILRFQTGRLTEALVDVNWVLREQPANVEMPRARQLKRILENALENAGR